MLPHYAMQNLQFPWQNGRTWAGALILLNLQQGEKHHATGQGRLHQLQPWSFQLMLFPLKNSTQTVGGGPLMATDETGDGAGVTT